MADIKGKICLQKCGSLEKGTLRQKMRRHTADRRNLSQRELWAFSSFPSWREESYAMRQVEGESLYLVQELGNLSVPRGRRWNLSWIRRASVLDSCLYPRCDGGRRWSIGWMLRNPWVSDVRTRGGGRETPHEWMSWWVVRENTHGKHNPGWKVRAHVYQEEHLWWNGIESGHRMTKAGKDEEVNHVQGALSQIPVDRQQRWQ